MLDVFRFAWFAVRTFLGFIALVLLIYGAMWGFVRILSLGPANADPDAALRRVRSYNAQAARHDRKDQAAAPARTSDCDAARAAGCARR